MTLRSKITSKNVEDGFVALNSLDAEELGLKKDSSIRITSPYGSIVSPVKIIKGMRVPRGHIFAPIHFFKYTNFNELTTTFPLDPRAAMPSLKKIPVKIEKV
jgi:anaerobic selenocysteine-containing dehydrogenase